MTCLSYKVPSKAFLSKLTCRVFCKNMKYFLSWKNEDIFNIIDQIMVHGVVLYTVYVLIKLKPAVNRIHSNTLILSRNGTLAGTSLLHWRNPPLSEVCEDPFLPNAWNGNEALSPPSWQLCQAGILSVVHEKLFKI